MVNLNIYYKKTRIFGGKGYKLAQGALTKSEADKIAKDFRDNTYLARVTKAKKNEVNYPYKWAIWVRASMRKQYNKYGKNRGLR